MNLALKPVLYIGFVLLSAHAQEEPLVSESISPLYFETMQYPFVGQINVCSGHSGCPSKGRRAWESDCCYGALWGSEVS